MRNIERRTPNIERGTSSIGDRAQGERPAGVGLGGMCARCCGGIGGRIGGNGEGPGVWRSRHRGRGICVEGAANATGMPAAGEEPEEPGAGRRGMRLRRRGANIDDQEAEVGRLGGRGHRGGRGRGQAFQPSVRLKHPDLGHEDPLARVDGPEACGVVDEQEDAGRMAVPRVEPVEPQRQSSVLVPRRSGHIPLGAQAAGGEARENQEGCRPGWARGRAVAPGDGPPGRSGAGGIVGRACAIEHLRAA